MSREDVEGRERVLCLFPATCRTRLEKPVRLDFFAPLESDVGEFPKFRQPDVTAGEELWDVGLAYQKTEEGEGSVSSRFVLAQCIKL
jgi:hypothetical protein